MIIISLSKMGVPISVTIHNLFRRHRMWEKGLLIGTLNTYFLEKYYISSLK